MTSAKTNITTELLLLLVLATCWGASYTFIRIGVATIPPITLIAARTLIAGGVLRANGLAMARVTDAATWKRFFIQSCLNSAIPFTLIAWAEQTVDAGLATILNSTTPIFAFLIAAFLLRSEPPTGRKLFGVIAGMAGICLIIGLDALHGMGRQLLPQLAVVAASIFYACAALFGRHFKGLDPMMPAAGSLLCGAVLLIPVSLIFEHPWQAAPSSTSILALLGLSVVSTALAFSIYFRLIQTLGPVGTTAQAYLRVPIGVGIGVAFLGEQLSPTAAIGLVCVVAGVMAMTIAPRKRVVAG